MHTIYRTRDGILCAIRRGTWRHPVASHDRYVWDATVLGDVPASALRLVLSSGIKTPADLALLRDGAARLLKAFA
jgi:hypothetical protein